MRIVVGSIAAALLVVAAFTAEAGHLVVSVSESNTSRTGRAAPGTDASAAVLSVLDASSFPPRVVAEIPVRHGALGPPTGVALTPDERLALVSMPTTVEGTGAAKIVRQAYLQIIDLDVTPPAETAKVPLPSPPIGLSVNRAGDLALVAHADGVVSVLKIAGKTVTAAGTVRVGDARSDVCHVAIGPEGRWALATKRGEGRVAVITIEGDTVRYTGHDVQAGGRPCMADIASNGRVAVVAGSAAQGDGSETLTLIDMTRAPLRAVATVPVGSRSHGVAISPDARSLVLTVGNAATKPTDRPFSGPPGKVALYSLTREEATRVADIDGQHDLRGVTFTPDGKYVLVQDRAEQDIAVYRVSPTGIADTGVRVKVKGDPVSIRIAPR